MKTVYKGFQVNVQRESEMLSFSVVRIADGIQSIKGYYQGNDSIRDYVKDLKLDIDDILENPDDYDQNLKRIR